MQGSTSPFVGTCSADCEMMLLRRVLAVRARAVKMREVALSFIISFLRWFESKAL